MMEKDTYVFNYIHKDNDTIKSYSNEEYREARPGQFQAPRAEMVARVREIVEADQ